MRRLLVSGYTDIDIGELNDAHFHTPSWRNYFGSCHRADPADTCPSALASRIAQSPLPISLAQRSSTIAALTHVTGVRRRTVCSLRCNNSRLTHHLCQNGVLSSALFLQVQLERTHLKIGQTATLPSGEVLELTSAEPQVPQAQLLGARLQHLHNGRGGGPSFSRVWGDLRVIQVFIWEHVVLASIQSWTEFRLTSMKSIKVVKTCFPFAEKSDSTWFQHGSEQETHHDPSAWRDVSQDVCCFGHFVVDVLLFLCV